MSAAPVPEHHLFAYHSFRLPNWSAPQGESIKQMEFSSGRGRGEWDSHTVGMVEEEAFS